MRLLALSHSTGVRIAEVAFLLFLIAGVWIVSASLTKVETTHTWLGFVVVASGRFRMIVAGVLVACGGLLLIVATHWGHLFSSGESLKGHSLTLAHARLGGYACS